MGILGAIIWFFMPAMTGFVAVKILRWKEMSQIETYLIGFFLLFFLQGILLVPLIFLKQSLQTAVFVIGALFLLITVLAIIFAAYAWKHRKKEQGDQLKTGWLKKEKVYFVLAIMTLLLVITRMVLTAPVLREGIMLETVKVSLETNTMYQFHPLTGTFMESGMIASKKIISLPMFYSCLVKMTTVPALVFLYMVMGLMLYMISIFACTLLYKKVCSVNRKKLFLFFVLYGLLVLSGDYHKSTLSYQILYQGYLGETICYAVILPYLLYKVVSWHQEEGNVEKVSRKRRGQYIFQLLLPLFTSFFIAGLGTGFVLLVICLFIAAACCLIQSIMEVHACKE